MPVVPHPDGPLEMGNCDLGLQPPGPASFPAGPSALRRPAPPFGSLFARPDFRSLLVLSPALRTPIPQHWPGFLEFVLLIETKHRGSSRAVPQRPPVGFSFPPSSLPRLGAGCSALRQLWGRHLPCTGCGVGDPSCCGGPSVTQLSHRREMIGDDKEASEGESAERGQLGESQEHPGGAKGL